MASIIIVLMFFLKKPTSLIMQFDITIFSCPTNNIVIESKPLFWNKNHKY